MRKSEDYFIEKTVDGEKEYLMSVKGVLLFTFNTYKREEEQKPKEISERFIKTVVQIMKEKGKAISGPKLMMDIRTSSQERMYEIVDEISSVITGADIQRIMKS